jgi:heat-inducible transcriptional repressor
MDDLTERQREILGIAVREYIHTAKPVGSGTICLHRGLNVSSATVRNEFVSLTELGYLKQPHTSAGRVPTAKGYRYFVEQLMQEAELPLAEQLLIRHQFHQIARDLDEWMKLAASVLAQVSKSASLIAAPQARRVRFRHVEMISISEFTGLMILVLQDGSVHQQMMVFAGTVTQDKLSRLSTKLNAEFANLTMDEMRAKIAIVSPVPVNALEAEVTERLVDLILVHETQGSREIYRDGLVQALRQPEFDEIDRARQIVEVLEQNTALEAIFHQAELANGVHVIIGGEGKWDEIRDFSMVLSGYGLPNEAKGVLGVLGPMRMRYGRTIPAVRYVAGLMSDLLNSLYGE